MCWSSSQAAIALSGGSVVVFSQTSDPISQEFGLSCLIDSLR